MKVKNITLKKLILANVFLLTLIFGFLFFKHTNVSADQPLSDAIAIRVIPNPNHFSAQRWYQSQGFTGSPQSLLVDGYKAVRDGRTVYVSATNINSSDFYTNIYLISYNQAADFQTVDIFGRILENWKFNTNLSSSLAIGDCKISKKSCYEDSDCPAGYYCQTTSGGVQLNKCLFDDSATGVETPSCIIDSDCPGDLFCDGLKAKIIRDLDRLEKIMTIKEKLAEYNQRNGNYPILGAGTYLSHVAVSTWPSWQNSFLSQVGVSSALDPINKLGSCADLDKKFNLDTCWNAVDNVFATSSNNINHSNFMLPADSYAMAYTTNPNGSDYKLCATMETTGYQITDGALNSNSCSMASAVGNIGLIGNNVNNAPYISESVLTGQSGQEFRGFVRAIDPEGHPFTWNHSFSTTFTGWSGVLQLLNTNNPNQKMIYASNAGDSGTYSFSLTLTDSLGSSSTETLTINITNTGPQIIGGNATHNISYGADFLNVININSENALDPITVCKSDSSGNCSSSPATFTIPQQIGSSCSELSIGGPFEACLVKIATGKYELRMSSNSTFTSSGSLTTGDHYYKITAVDEYNGTTSMIVKIEITANPPIINFNNCLKVVNLGDYYECPLKTDNYSSSTITFSTTTTSLPKGLVLDTSDDTIKGYLLELGSHETEVEATHTTYNSVNSVSRFTLNVTSDCGNYTVQHPGGPWNYSGTARNHSGYYRTVLIGNQCWLQDNLNLGTQVPATTTTNNFNNELTEKYCYDNDSINCDIYGGLYNFTETMDIEKSCLNSSTGDCTGYDLEGICPPGWRVPTDSDWYALENGLTDVNCTSTRAGTINTSGVISANAWSCSPAGEALKSSGLSNFKALLINYLDYSNSVIPFKTPFDQYANFRTSTYANNNNAYSRHIEKGSSKKEIARVSSSKSNGYSVRCIKDSKQCLENSDCPTDHTCSSQNICVQASGSPQRASTTGASI